MGVKKQHRLVLLLVCLILIGVTVYPHIPALVKIAQAVQGELKFGSTMDQVMTVINKTYYSADVFFGNASGGRVGVLKGTGNVGIGNITPNHRLSVEDTMAITAPSGIQYLLMGNQDSAGQGNPAIIRSANGNLEIGKGTAWVGPGGTFTSNVFFANGGNVGIGSTAPTKKLDVVGDINFSGTLYQAGSPFTGSKWTNTTGGIYYNSGNVGVGTTAPLVPFDVVGNVFIGLASERLSLRSGDIGFNRNTATGAIFNSNERAFQIHHDGSTNTATDYLAYQVYDGAGTQITPSALVVKGDGNIGIGTTNPTKKLDIVAANSTINNTSGNLSIVPNANLLITQGNVGIGSASPGTKLDVAGVINGRNYVIPDTAATPQWVKIGTFTANQAGQTIRVVAYIHQGYNATNTQDSSYYITFKTSNSASVDANGFAGNGSWYAIGFNGSIPSGNIKWKANAAGVSATAYDLYIYLPVFTNNSHYQVTVPENASWANAMTLGQADPGVASSSVLVPTPEFNLPYGNVGIGSTAPAAKLDVGGTTSTIANVSGNLSIIPASNLVVTQGNVGIGTSNPGTANLAVMGGNVGIGTTGPGAKLEVKYGSSANLTLPLILNPGYYLPGTATGIGFLTDGDGTYIKGALAYESNGTGWNVGKAFHFLMRSDNNTTPVSLADAKLTILNTGNVGIGTSAPTQTLEVAGTALLDVVKRTNPFSGSVLINAQQGDTINNWVGNIYQTWTLCYRKSTHGASSGTMHANCDNKGQTVSIANLSTGKLIGGYAGCSWDSKNNYHYGCGGSFLFSLTNGHKYSKHTYHIDTTSSYSYLYWIYDNSTYGPTWGGGHDWYVNGSISGGYCNLGHDYTCRKGTYGSAACQNEFCGTYNSWSVTDLEVWYVNN